MILLLAKSNHDAEIFAHNNGLRNGTWHYIISVCSLRGMGRPHVCRVGSYWQRSDIVAIESELDKRKAVAISFVDTVRKSD